MPQLDRVVVFTQIFWIVIFFSTTYFIITIFILPRIIKIIKIRFFFIKINSTLIHSLKIEELNYLTKSQIILRKGFKISKNLITSQIIFYQNTIHNYLINLNIKINLNKTLINYLQLNPVFKIQLIKGLNKFPVFGYYSKIN